MTKAAWYFDFISPFSYLQLGRFQDLPQDLEIALKPVLFSGLLNRWGHMGPAEIPPKRQFVYRFFRWQAEPARDAIHNASSSPFQSSAST